MKKRKIAALLLVASLGALVFSISACSDKKSNDRGDEIETEEETDVVETEATETDATETKVEETEPAVETEATEEIEETEIPEESSKPNEAITVRGNEDNEADAVAYELFMDYVRNGTFDDDALFLFDKFRYGQGDPVDSRWGLVINTGDESVAYAVIDGQVVETTLGHDWYPEGGSLRENFLQLPMMLEVGIGELVSSGDIEDGTYHGTLYSCNEEGTQLLVTIGRPVIIDASTFDSLDSVDDFTDIYGNSYNVEVRYEVDYADSTVVSLTTDYNEHVHGWFVSLDDGNYILYSDSDYTPYAYAIYCIIDISPDCQIEDYFIWLGGVGDGDPTVGVNPDEPMTMTNSYYYDYLRTYMYGNVYNGWMSGGNAILEPVEIVNGEIVSMVLGWR